MQLHRAVYLEIVQRVWPVRWNKAFEQFETAVDATNRERSQSRRRVLLIGSEARGYIFSGSNVAKAGAVLS